MEQVDLLHMDSVGKQLQAVKQVFISKHTFNQPRFINSLKRGYHLMAKLRQLS